MKFFPYCLADEFQFNFYEGNLKNKNTLQILKFKAQVFWEKTVRRISLSVGF